MHRTRLARIAAAVVVSALVLVGLVASPASAFPGQLKGWVVMHPYGGVARDAHEGEVIVHYAAVGESTLNSNTATTDEHGKFLFTGITEDRLQLYFEYVGTEGYLSSWYGQYSGDTIPRGSVEVYDHVVYSMVMQQPSPLGGSATLEGGTIPPDGQLTVSYRSNIDLQWTEFGSTQVVGPDGRYEFPELPDGSYQLRFDYSGPGPWMHRYYWDSPDLQQAGQQQFPEAGHTIDLVMPSSAETVSGHVYRGTPVFPDTWESVGAGEVTISVSYQYVGEPEIPLPQFTTTTTAGGAYSITGLPPRPYYTLTYTYSGPGYFFPVSTQSDIRLGFDSVVVDHVIPPTFLELVDPPVVTGTYRVGGTVAVSKGTYTVPPTNFQYQWQRDGADIPQADFPTYVLTPADFGHALQAVVAVGYPGRVPVVTTTDATPVIAGGTLAKAPAPTISGSARVGRTLTAKPGTWPAGTTFTYQWSANGVPLIDATNVSIAVPPVAVGKKLTVAVSGTVPGYLPYPKTSAATSKAVATSFTAAPTPHIVGSPQVGVQLTVDPGTWAPDATFNYQWYSNGNAIKNATTAAFTPSGSQLGKRLTVKVTGSAQGYVSTARTSAKSSSVKQGVWSATPLPEISGVPQVGLALAASTPGWQSTARFAYQWYANNAPISKATKSTFVPTASQRDKVITVRITTTTSGYPTVKRASAPTGAVASGVFTSTPTPTITGTTRVGSTLKAVTVAWAPTATYHYEWLADGVVIPTATASTFKLTSAQAGAEITVAVTGTRSGFASVTRGSLPTAAVLP